MPCPPEGFTLYQQTAALNLRGIPIFPILISQPKPDPIFSRGPPKGGGAGTPQGGSPGVFGRPHLRGGPGELSKALSPACFGSWNQSKKPPQPPQGL